MKELKNVFESKESEGIRQRIEVLKIDHANGKVNKL